MLLFPLQVQSIIARHQASFAAAGANLSLQRAQQSYWLQIDVAAGPVVRHPGTHEALLPGTVRISAVVLLLCDGAAGHVWLLWAASIKAVRASKHCLY
jgi:hypothetical protein